MNRQQEKSPHFIAASTAASRTNSTLNMGKYSPFWTMPASTDFPTLISSVTGGIAARQPTDRNTAVCFRLSQAVM